MKKIILAVFLVSLVAALSACGGGGATPPPATTTYTIAYDGNGSTSGIVPIDATAYGAGQTVTVLGNTGTLAKTGSAFAGWNTLADGTGTTYAQAQTFVMAAANVTLYAKWTANPTYTVTYDGNGGISGSVPIDSTNYEQGQNVTILANTGNLAKTGYNLAGWNLVSDGTGTTYTKAQTFAMPAANVTLYAKWTVKWAGTKLIGVAGTNTEAYGVAVDASGNVYAVGYTSGGLDGNTLTGTSDACLTKYDSSGNKLYTKLIGAAGKDTWAAGVAVDASGNVYVTGSTGGGMDGNTLTGTRDFFLTVYDSAGTKVRTKQLGVAGQITDANSVAVDANGNVYVAGTTYGGLDGNSLTGGYDFFLTMYDASGNKVRTKQLGVAGKITTATGVAVDASGNVYVAGYTQGGLDGNTLTGKEDFFVIMYDSTGNKVRTKQLGAAGAWTLAYGVAVDANGNVYVAGWTSGGLDGNTVTGIEDFFVTMYDASGNKVRTKQVGVAGTVTDAWSVAVDAGGNVYVAGHTQGGLDGNTRTGLADFFVTKYDSSGNKVRTKQLGVAGATTEAAGVAVDANDNVYVMGYTNGGLDGNTLIGSEDIFVTVYDSAGNKQ
jgi:uncharacterized repeat protein (TIGR02543 family)